MSVDLVGDQKLEIEITADEFELLHVLDERAKRVPEIPDIGKQDRLAMAAELNPGDLLDDFFKRADAARHCHEGVGHLEHLALALVHVVGHDKIVDALQGKFTGDQKFGNDAGRVAAMVEHRLARSRPSCRRSRRRKQGRCRSWRGSAPKARAPSTKAGSVPGPEPQYTQILPILLVFSILFMSMHVHPACGSVKARLIIPN